MVILAGAVRTAGHEAGGKTGELRSAGTAEVAVSI